MAGARNVVCPLSVTTSGGVTTITLPSGTVFKNRCMVKIGMYVDVPAGTNGTQVNVTNGEVTYPILNHMGNYMRPCRGLRQGMLYPCMFLNDPAHFIFTFD